MIQKELQAIQKSDQGFNVASYLLQQESRNCKYFGALTYAVVIQNTTLDDEKIAALIASVQGHLRDLLADSAQLAPSLFIVKKLMSDLSLLYIKKPAFANPVCMFMKALGFEQEFNIQSFSGYLSQLPATLLGLLLVFFSILVGDFSKLNDYGSSINIAVKSDIFPYLEVTYEYLNFLQENNQLKDDMNVQALETLNSWMSYIPNNSGDARYESSQLVLIIKFLLLQLQQPTDVENDQRMNSIRLCLLTFNEILEVNAPLLTPEEKLYLYATLFESGKWGDQFMNAVIFTERREEFHDEVNAFIDLVLTVLQLNTIKLSKSILDPNTQNIFGIAHKLTSIQGVALADEFISERMLAFWEELANVYQDSSDIFENLFNETEDPQFREEFEAEKKSIFIEIAKVYWKKIHYPDLSVYNSIKGEFRAYRNSVAEFFLGAYALLKADFYEMICESLVNSVEEFPNNQGLIADIEATLYLLYKINDDTIYFESQERLISPFSLRIFRSNIMGTFREVEFSDTRGQLFYSTFVQYLASNEFFFKTPEGSAYLGQVFDMLFPIIMASSSNLSLLASKTATKICEECSQSLTGFLPNLEVVVIEMLKNPSIDSLIRLRMFNAYSVIAKSIEDLNAHGKLVQGMVIAVKEASNAMMEVAQNNLSEDQEDYLVSLISCLVNIGKGSALSDDEIDQMLAQQEVDYREFWQEDRLAIKPVILEIVTKYLLEYQPLCQKTMVVEKCLLVFKTGIGEKLGGPFEFDEQLIAQYLVSLMERLTNPNAVPYVFGILEYMITVRFSKISDILVGGLIDRLFIQRLDFLKTDPDMIKSAIDLFSKIIEYKPSLIIHSPSFSNTIIRFALDGFQANESFIVKSILKFWINTINIKHGTREDHEAMTKLFVDEQLGRLVTSDLLRSFLRSTRSHLDYYYNVFRSLVGKYPLAFKHWLILSLEELKPNVLKKVDDRELSMFVQKLMVTRGARTANDVLKQFWLTANGLVEYNNQKY